MRLIFLILTSILGNCLIAATIPLPDPANGPSRRYSPPKTRLSESFELSVIATENDSAFSPPPINIFPEVSPIAHPTALRLTSGRGYERLDLREEHKARGELANYYTQTWLKHFTRQWFARTKAAKNFQKINQLTQSRSVALSSCAANGNETAQTSTLLLNYGYSLLEDRGHIELQGEFWRIGLEVGKIIGGEIADVSARSYLYAKLSEAGPHAIAECENRYSRCRLSLSQPIPGGLGASIEVISRADESHFRIEHAGIFLSYQGPIPFLSL